jgi:acyl-CoA reductase-like NAD-dependent aldehyde dehydrogenase
MMAFLHTGQICFCIKRIFVHESIYDAFLAGFVEFAKALKAGGPTDAEAALGPIQNRMQYDKLRGLYADVDAQGYNKAFSGGTFGAQGGDGYFVPTVVLDNPPDDSRVVTEEQFGPIIPLLKWSNDDDVIKRANATLYGLGGSVWSRDLPRAERMARRLEAGTVWTNAHFDVGPQVSFGGFKESGLGVESGLEGIKEWCNRQAVWARK